MPIRLRHDVRTIEGVVTASGNSAGLDDPTFRTFGSPRRVSMMAVTGFWVRIVDWDGGAPAGVPQTLVAFCDKAYTRSGSSLWVTPNGVRRPALRVWYAWIFAAVLLALLALSARLTTLRWRREIGRS
jgi:hypothetical protein